MVSTRSKRTRVMLYVEGGGETERLQEPLRSAFHKFLEGLPRQPRIACCGGRGETLRDFRNGIRDNPNQVHVLLLDSETEVTTRPKAHIESEFKPEDVPDIADEHYHLMVQVMETWILAHPESIRMAYPFDADLSAVPHISDYERVSKAAAIDTLTRATGGKYSRDNKRLAAARILQHARAETVADKVPHCDRLIAHLESVLN